MTLYVVSKSSAFRRTTLSNHPIKIESSCEKCRRFIAASTRERMVETVESIHLYSGRTMPKRLDEQQNRLLPVRQTLLTHEPNRCSEIHSEGNPHKMDLALD
jgi:hypothetical protein